MRTLLLLFCLLLAGSAKASPVDVIFSPAQTGVSAALLSSSPVTSTLSIRGLNSVSMYVNHTYTAATALGMTCKAGASPATLSPVPVSNPQSTGAIGMADASWSYPTTGVSRLYRIMVAPLNDIILQCTFTGTGASSDTITVTAYGADD